MNRLFLPWHIWHSGRRKPAAVTAIQHKRLNDLVVWARTRSPFYARHYRQVQDAFADLQALPPVTKTELMACFDDWVTDAAVTRARVNEFVSDSSLAGRLFLERYAIHTTSGTTGTPGLFLHDHGALAVYDLLWLLRGWLPWLGPWRLLDALRADFREVFVVDTGAHFGGTATAERLRRRYPWMAGRLQILSVLLPTHELVYRLNDLQPTVLAIYPTALSVLSGEQRNGRLSIHPLLIVTSGEWLASPVRDEATAAFDCSVRDVYACSEFIYTAFSCGEGWLHANADWLILEPVDAGYDPVPAGETSQTVLLTNLANRIQPLIRYDLGDSVTLRPDPCPCGNPLPALRVEGRRDEILNFYTSGGATVQVLPVALATVVETTPGVQRYQVIQTERCALSVRLEAVLGAEPAQVWETVRMRLREFLNGQGLSGVAIQKATQAPRRDPRSGKFRQVWSDVRAKPQ